MAKEALIKLRCSTELKARLEKIAERREQNLSDFIRTRLIDLLPELEHTAGVEEAPAPYISNRVKKKSPRRPRTTGTSVGGGGLGATGT